MLHVIVLLVALAVTVLVVTAASRRLGLAKCRVSKPARAWE